MEERTVHACTHRKSGNNKARKTNRDLNHRRSKLNTNVYEESHKVVLSLPTVPLYLTIKFYCSVPV